MSLLSYPPPPNPLSFPRAGHSATFDYTATRIIGGADLINSTVDMADVEGWDVPTGDIDAQGRDVGAH